MNTFKAGQKLSQASICDSECIFTGTVVKRTAKTVTINTSMKGEKRCKIHLDDEGNEYCFPFGQYSMAVTFNAPAEEAEQEPTTQTINNKEHEIAESETLKIGDTVWCINNDKNLSIHARGLITGIRRTSTGIVIDLHSSTDEVQSLRADNFTISVLTPASRTVFIARYASNAFAEKPFNTRGEAVQAIQDTFNGVNLSDDVDEDSREYWRNQARMMVIVEKVITIEKVYTGIINK